MGGWNTNLSLEDIETWKKAVADAILKGKRLTEWQRESAYLFIMGEFPEKSKRGAPKGERTTERNVKMFLHYQAYIEKGVKPPEARDRVKNDFLALGDEALKSSIRKGKEKWWRQFADREKQLKGKLLLLRFAKDSSQHEALKKEVTEELCNIEEEMKKMNDLGLGPRNRGWLSAECKKNRSK